MNVTSTSTAYVPGISLFAKLLASENLTVTVDNKATTASFMPKERVLTLPSWIGFTQDAWLLFVAHEVGHALYTPATSFTHPTFTKLTAQYGHELVRNIVNVFEDVRIERLIRRQYQGLTGVFSRGYLSLLSQNFFGGTTGTIDWPTWMAYGPMDRINVYGKVGALIRLPLDRPKEIAWYNAALLTATFDDVMDLTERALSEATFPSAPNHSGGAGVGQADPQGQPVAGAQPGAGDGDSQGQGQPTPGAEAPAGESASESNEAGESGAGESGQGDSGQSDATKEASGESNESATATGDAAGDTAGQGGARPDDMTVQTAKAAEEKLKASVDTVGPYGYGADTTVMLPSQTDWMHRQDVTLTECLRVWEATPAERAVFAAEAVRARKGVEPVLASMVAAFRAHQSAWAQRRVQVARTGLIDPVRLANYKLVDDIFLRRRAVPNAQNHGFVLTVDWSGSMSTNISTVLWQVLHLLWFAEAVRVPILVQAFTNAAAPTPEFDKYQTDRRTAGQPVYPVGSALVTMYDSTAVPTVRHDAYAHLMMMILRSGMQSGDYYNSFGYSDYSGATVPKSARPHVAPTYDALKAVWSDLFPTQVSARFRKVCLAHSYLHMGGTPLAQAILSSIDTVRHFRERHRIEQCISVWLTDGEDTDGICPMDPAKSGTGHAKNVRPVSGATWVDPRSGRVFHQTEKSALPTLLEIHRALTGATTIVIDMTAYPVESLRRVVPSAQVGYLVPRIVGVEPEQPVVANAYGRRLRRRSRGGYRAKVVTQTRRKVVLPTAGGTFADTGILVVSRKEQPKMGCDAYVVSHPAWWKGEMAQSQTAAVRSIVGRLRSMDEDLDDEDDDLTSASGRGHAAVEDAQWSETATKLSAALNEQTGNQTMRRFADILIPFMAAGRDDVS